MARFYRIDILIDEVRKRRELWDSDHQDHMNRSKKSQSWREICQACDPSFEKLSKEKKYLFISEMQKKWKGLRNSYTRELKIRKQIENNPGVKVRRKTYMYYDQLSFLQPYIMKNNRRPLNPEHSDEEVIEIVIEEERIEISDDDDDDRMDSEPLEDRKPVIIQDDTNSNEPEIESNFNKSNTEMVNSSIHNSTSSDASDENESEIEECQPQNITESQPKETGNCTSQKNVVSPQKNVGTPQKSVVPPQKSVVSPQKSVVPPQKSVVSPEKSVLPPQKNVALTKRNVDCESRQNQDCKAEVGRRRKHRGCRKKQECQQRKIRVCPIERIQAEKLQDCGPLNDQECQPPNNQDCQPQNNESQPESNQDCQPQNNQDCQPENNQDWQPENNQDCQAQINQDCQGKKNQYSPEKSQESQIGKIRVCSARKMLVSRPQSSLTDCKIMIAKDKDGKLNLYRMQPSDSGALKVLHHEYSRAKENLSQQMSHEPLDALPPKYENISILSLKSKTPINYKLVCGAPPCNPENCNVSTSKVSLVGNIAKLIDNTTKEVPTQSKNHPQRLFLKSDLSYTSMNGSPIKRRILEHASDNNAYKKTVSLENGTSISEQTANKESDGLSPNLEHEKPVKKPGGLCYVSSVLSSSGNEFISNHPNHMVLKTPYVRTEVKHNQTSSISIRKCDNSSISIRKCDNSVEDRRKSSGNIQNGSVLKTKHDISLEHRIYSNRNNTNSGNSKEKSSNNLNRSSNSSKHDSLEKSTSSNNDPIASTTPNSHPNNSSASNIGPSEEYENYSNFSRNTSNCSSPEYVTLEEEGCSNGSNNIANSSPSNKPNHITVAKCADDRNSLSKSNDTSTSGKSDSSLEDDKMFLMSLLNEFNAVPNKYKFDVKIEFLKAIRNYSKKD